MCVLLQMRVLRITSMTQERDRKMLGQDACKKKKIFGHSQDYNRLQKSPQLYNICTKNPTF